MSKEFKRMQQLAGLITENQAGNLLNEIRILSPYQHILELYINSYDADSFFDDAHKKKVELYLNSLKPPPKVGTVEELASIIKKMDDTINELTNYPEDLFDEEVIPQLEQIASDNPDLKNAVDRTLAVLSKLYGREDNDDNDDDDDDEFGWDTDYDEY
jgi:hypothetical protein